jgi:cytochrome c553
MPAPRAGRWVAGLTALLFGAGLAQAQLEEKLRTCGACHGADGVSQTAGVPSLAGQPKIFLENYLVLTREGIAGTDVMRGLLKGVPDKDIVALAKHFSGLPAKGSSSPVDRKLFEKGKEIAAKNRCGSCHLKDFSGREQMPRLGQREEYLAAAMLAYKQNKRPGGDTIMAASLYDVAEADLKALAHYLSRLR